MARIFFAAALSLSASALTSGCNRNESDTSTNNRTRSHSTSTSGAWFTDITDQVGLDFVHESGASGEYYMPEITGPGAAFLDFDQDGDLDIYLINGHTELPSIDPVRKLKKLIFRTESNDM